MTRGTPLALALLAACGGAPPPVPPPPSETPVVAAPPLFSGHGPVVLRSVAATPALTSAEPPFYAELAADGAITGTRCAATRFTDDGALEREGVLVARVSREGDALVVRGATETGPEWRIEGATLIAGARFPITNGAITPADAELPAVSIDPPTTPDALALALFATLLICDDIGP